VNESASVRLRRAFPVLAAWLLGACAATGARGTGAAPPPHRARTTPAWSLTAENDSFALKDGNYTSGVRLGWLSPEIHHLEPSSVSRRVARAADGLPGIDADGETYVGFAGGQLIFTPESLLNPNPPLDERPYAGIVYFDTSVMTRDGNRLTAWFLRLGAVGKLSYAEQTQKELHKWFGADHPRGWAHQLRDEPLLNVGVERYVRTASGELGGGLRYDVTPNYGAALGNYFTGLDAGLQVRVGHVLPLDIGAARMRTSLSGSAIVDGGTPEAYAFLGIDGYAVAHYLPIDGNVFVDGRGIESRDWVASGRLGYTFTHGPLAITLAYTVLTDTYDAQQQVGQYGTISLAWFR